MLEQHMSFYVIPLIWNQMDGKRCLDPFGLIHLLKKQKNKSNVHSKEKYITQCILCRPP